MRKRPGKRETAATARVVKLILTVLLAPALLSCAGRIPAEKGYIPRPDKKALIERITFDRVDTLSGRAGIRIYRGDEYVAYLTGALNYRRPDSLALSVFGPFGMTVMKMLITAEGLEIYVPSRDTLYVRPMHIPFLLPDSGTISSSMTVMKETDDDYILEIYRSGGETDPPAARYFFDKRTLRNRRMEKFNGDSFLFAIDIDELNEMNIPTVFTISAGESRYEISASGLSVNEGVPERAFEHMTAGTVLPLQDFLRTLAPNQ